MSRKVCCIIKRPDERYGHKTAISTSLENLQKTVEGYVEAVALSEDVVILCNEEGRLNGMPYNCTICGMTFFGTLIFIGTDGEEFANIPISYREYKRIFFGVDY